MLYEIVVGHPPFGQADTGFAQMERILDEGEIRMKDYFSKEFKSLLYGLLERNVKRRLTLA